MIPLGDTDLDIFARIWHAQHFRSRRRAKAMLYESTGQRDAGTLNRVLAHIRDHPQAGEIIDRAEAIEAARLEGQRRAALAQADPRGDLPEWLIGETPEWGRTFIVHFCPCGAHSFCGEIFDDAAQAPGGLEAWPLDEGQMLSNITWIDGERPTDNQLERLMRRARRELRLHDAQGDG